MSPEQYFFDNFKSKERIKEARRQYPELSERELILVLIQTYILEALVLLVSFMPIPPSVDILQKIKTKVVNFLVDETKRNIS